MIDLAPDLAALSEEPTLAPWLAMLPRLLERNFHQRLHGDFPAWMEQIRALPDVAAGIVHLDRDQVGVEGAEPPSPALRAEIERRLQALHPWRKGPYRIHGVDIDSEWRSDWKWQRLEGHITPLDGRLVLDVGCGNGYHLWRMAGAGARRAVGIDPTQLFLTQFLAVRRFLGDHWPVHLLPLGIEAMPAELRAFDSVFSMGVLYHRRSPLDHLLTLRGLLRPGGELVLETLVIEGGPGQVLLPPGRYARMRNVWFIPSPATLAGWLERCGFRHPQVVDVTVTTPEEQRATPWMRFESLADCLDPADPSRTVEGHPAPRRAILIADAPCSP